MKIAIRVDVSSQIGTGHFMRCLTLADVLKQRGAQTCFVSRHLPEYLRDMLKTSDHEFAQLNSISREETAGDLFHAHWLGTSQAQDAEDTIQALSNQTWDWLIVDHYALDVRWEIALRQTAKNILAIDDIADRQHDCDVLLDQNYYADMDTRYIGKVPAHCKPLLGPRYALLRDEFRQLHEQVKPRTGPVKRVLVFFGGADADNYTALAVEALAGVDINGLQVDVVIGMQHPFKEKLESLCAKYGFYFHVQSRNMARLMAAADLAIGAGGSTTWERCCMGLPTLTICTAENQIKQVVEAASEGMLYAPDSNSEFTQRITHHLYALLENISLRQAISRNAMRAVDGRGVLRVIRNLDCGGIEIRATRYDDSQKIFEWRNHPAIRAVSRNAEVLDWDSHQKWFSGVLADPDRLLLIGQRNGLPVGVVRFDIRGGEAEVSIYLVPDTKQSGQGSCLLQSAERWLFARQPEVFKINAQVMGVNKHSHHLFLGAGYQVESTSYSKRLR